MTLFALALVFVIPVAGSAASGQGSSGDQQALIPNSLLTAAQADPSKNFPVIVQAVRGKSSADVANDVRSANGDVKRLFASVSGVSANLKGGQILGLQHNSHVLSITPDVKVKSADYQSAEMWRDTVDMTPLYSGPKNALGVATAAPQAPAIAVIDSGVDSSKLADFGARVVANVNMSSLSSSSADEEGHGTMVAALAAGSNALHMGAAPNAPIVALKTANADGESVTSDVIAACDWVLANAKKYNIKVVNMSLAGAAETSFRVDPLDKAVERLWLSGITVVVAAGNHGTGAAVTMSYAPGNDPYVITVGALDQQGTSDPSDDTTPSWSAFGTTMDGFQKPDVSAPGRYMISAVPAGATIPQTVPDRIVSPGYMWMSGTSFATPIVAGAAAQVLARHPSWTPDQVKGALMLTANYIPNAVDDVSAGVGEIDAAAAASLSSPPDPNENLHGFEQVDSATGLKTFNAANWATAVASQANWSQANWAAASWSSANWSEANWSEANWSAANWTTSLDSMMASLASWSE